MEKTFSTYLPLYSDFVLLPVLILPKHVCILDALESAFACDMS